MSEKSLYQTFLNLKAADVTNEAGKVNELVTVVIKTFIRYPCLIRLVKSIRQFYPFITIIIADDRHWVCKLTVILYFAS